MASALREIVELYDSGLPLAEASTIPAPWYTDVRIAELERQTVLARSWQPVAHADQLRTIGDFITAEVAGEPVLVVRGSDNVLRGFFNVCRHHAAAVMTSPSGRAANLRCPYHGWTYTLEGALKGAPQFAGVCNFDPSANGLPPLAVATWEKWVFVRIAADAAGEPEFPDASLAQQIRDLDLASLRWFERKSYFVECNWKVYVDNYLDGGYHVPHLHQGLDSVLAPGQYTIDCGARFCVQSSALAKAGSDGATANASDADVASVRRGERALYLWLYPNLMINWYEGVMDTNLVVPHGVERTEVIFDYYFADVSAAARDRNRASIAVSERIQDEDAAICASVQRGLRSRSYLAGRLSVRREAGEHLFHRLLHADLSSGC